MLSNVYSAEKPLDMNIFYATDEGYAKPTCVSLASVLANITDNERLHVYIVDSGMSQMSIRKINNLKSIRDFDLHYKRWDIPNLEKFELRKWNKNILVKLFVAEIFEDLDKILWMDGDTVANKNIRELYETDLTSKYMAAFDFLTPTLRYRRGGATTKFPYWINVGVSLFNIDLMKRDNLQKQLLIAGEEYTDSFERKEKTNGGVEEYAFTKVISSDKFFHLPYRYNAMIWFFPNISVDQTDVGMNFQSEIENTVIYHYGAGFAPWRFPKTPLRYPDKYSQTAYDTWYKYNTLTDYKGEPPHYAKRIYDLKIVKDYKKQIKK